MVDYTKVTKLRDPDGNIVPCKYSSRCDAQSFWVTPLRNCYQNGSVNNRAECLLLFLDNGNHKYGRKYTLIVEEEKETASVKKATFTSTETVRKPTHWRNKESGSVMWRAMSAWNRITLGGAVYGPSNISHSPDTHPETYEACYGDLVITISER